jgi:hypothetical protein
MRTENLDQAEIPLTEIMTNHKTLPINLNIVFSRWDIIPDSWKDDLDSKLLSIQAANRNYILRCHESSSQVAESGSQEFLRGLKGAWLNHNAFFRLQQQLLGNLMSVNSVSKNESEEIIQILKDTQLVDTVTIFYGLGTKLHLERRSKELGVTISPFRTFYLDYPYEHLTQTDEFLIGKYHSGSKSLFFQRAKKPPLNLIKGLNSKKMAEELREKRADLFNSTLYNLWLDRSAEIKALVEISTSDNSDEYVWMYNLEGIEGFCLKSWIYSDSNFNIDQLTEYTSLGLEERVTKKVGPWNGNLPRLTDTPAYQRVIGWFKLEAQILEERGITVVL